MKPGQEPRTLWAWRDGFARVPKSGKLTGIGAILVVVLAGACAVYCAADSPAPSMDGCSGRMWLEPISETGYFWDEHRYWLRGPAPFNHSRYMIINARTNTAYTWSFIGHDWRGRALFGVRTRWTWFHPRWAADPWLLLYECP
jgi:hypothetical protein